MDWSSSRNWVARVGATALAFALGASASAGTLYSWKTEDGTFAYTNEKKRIPAKYKGEAQKSQMKSMKSYSRFTPGPKIDDTAYGDRIVQRLEVLHAASSEAAASAAGPFVGSQAYVKLELGDESGNAIEIPIDMADGDAGPIVVEHVRVRPEAGHLTSRHFRVVKQGDRILAVIKDRALDQDLTGLNQRDFDPSSVE